MPDTRVRDLIDVYVEVREDKEVIIPIAVDKQELQKVMSKSLPPGLGGTSILDGGKSLNK